MRKYIIILLFTVLAGCRVEITERNEYDILYEIFTEYEYIADVVDEWQTYRHVKATFAGDCEDAVTLYIGMVYEETGVKHGAGIYRLDDRCHAAVHVDIVDYPLTPFDVARTLNGWELVAEYTYDEWMLLTYIR